MDTLYSYSGNDIAEFRRTYMVAARQEYYDGDLGIDASDRFDMTLQRALAEPIALLRVKMRSGMSYHRSWRHIRSNKVGVRVIWFVREGEAKIVRSQGACTVVAGECFILDSNMPFYIHTHGENGFDAITANVPAHLFLSHLPVATEFNTPFEIDAGGRHVISKLLDLLFSEGDHLSRSAVEPLVTAFLATLSDNISELVGRMSTRENAVDMRFAEIRNYIMKNLTNPDLGYSQVAAHCRISTRYMCNVLKANNTSFSKLLWSQRLLKARDWLVTEAMHSYPIHEIAFMAGFKSAAHFSRMFKSVYHCSPKEYRVTGKTVLSEAA